MPRVSTKERVFRKIPTTSPMYSQILLSYLQKVHQIDPKEINDNSGLFSEGFLDSMAIVDLVAFIQDAFSLRIEPNELNLDNLDSVSKLTQFIAKKKC